MSERDTINTYDQLAKAGGGIAILRHSGGIRDTYVDGWTILRLVDGKQVDTDPQCKQWYLYKQKFFGNFRHDGSFHQRQQLAFEDAAKWVAETYGEKGPWKRNRLGDFIPERINKQFPLRKREKRGK